MVDYKDVIIMGDFNISLNNYELDADTQQYLDSTIALGYEQHVKFATRNKGNILDHIYSESESHLKICNIKVDELRS